MEEIKCKCCGTIENVDPCHFNECDVRTIMEETGFCYSCSFWEIHARSWESGNREGIYFINGTRYHDCGIVDKSKMRWPLGHGGRDFKIRLLGSDEIIKTNNLWCQGDVPELFKKRLPDNAEFVKDTHRVLTTKGLKLSVFRGLEEECKEFISKKDVPSEYVIELL